VRQRKGGKEVTDSEIRGFYRDSKDKNKAVKYLRDMTVYRKNEILKILESGGYDVSMFEYDKEDEEVERTYTRNFDEAKALELYNKGTYDGVIATECKVTRATVVMWRKDNNLISKYALKKEDAKSKILDLYYKGLNDRQISEEVGLSTNTIRVFRNNHGLKPVKKEKAAQLAL